MFWVGFSWVTFLTAIFLYAIRMFGITGGYHRYFSHKTYQTSRWFQFLLGFLGTSAGQMGPLWWAAHHRHHHRYSDQPQDTHSPVQDTLFWSHMGWFMTRSNAVTRENLIADFSRFAELRWLNKHYWVPPFVLASLVFSLGWLLEVFLPSLGTTKWQMLVWGFFVSTTALYHGTFLVNSLAHLWGTKTYETGDDSRNNFWIAIFTLGEGWHNNHHRFPQFERHAHRWWQYDPTHWTICVLAWLGLVWNIRVSPKKILKPRLESSSPQSLLKTGT